MVLNSSTRCSYIIATIKYNINTHRTSELIKYSSENICIKCVYFFDIFSKFGDKSMVISEDERERQCVNHYVDK